MRRSRWMMAGVVAGSVGLGAVLGAALFSPGVSFAAADEAGGDAATVVCAGVLGTGPLSSAADAIGIEPVELLRALREGQTIAEVAGDHGVDVDVVIDAIVSAERERLDTAVENGWLTREQADERAAELEERATELVNGEAGGFPLWRRPGRWDRVGPVFPGPWGHPALWGFADGPLAAAADAIGIEPDALLEAVRDGQTVAEVAQANGVPAEDVIDAIVAALAERLDAAVENGWISRERADERIAGLEDVAEAIVNGDLRPVPLPRPGWPGGPWGAHLPRVVPEPGGGAEVEPADASVY